MAPLESPEELARRFEREKRAAELQREERLNETSGRFRIGSVPYLNAVPLTRGLEEQVLFLPPSQLAERLARKELDAALVSVTEVLFHDQYDVLDGVAIAALGEVVSVFLAHQGPLEKLEVIHCDTASLTSVNLLRVLLAERGLSPRFEPLGSYDEAVQKEAVLLIGNPAIEFLRTPHSHQIWDLGSAWFELTKLPFLYAVWALQRGIENNDLRRQLKEARDFGLDTLDHIIASETAFDLEFRTDYLGWHIHYHLGSDEKRGLALFMKLLEKHGNRPVYSPRFIA
ncbi:MAG: menaquinone biosynthesis protein [Verrucomicrobiota bacterium]|nr:menaquinone biosynthesis protein [Verrucomicrobiota bacterium]